jgi:hypothetical protein
MIPSAVRRRLDAHYSEMARQRFIEQWGTTTLGDLSPIVYAYFWCERMHTKLFMTWDHDA